MKKILLLFLLSSSIYAQSEYPQDYFRNPLDITLVLSGTFGELRSSHFHSGLDIKTQQKQGLKVYAATEGYVSRIKISHYGYGKAIYITHPNGYTTVYGHLQKFSERIEKYIKECQYDKESFEVEVFPSSQELIIEPNEVIAYSGDWAKAAYFSRAVVPLHQRRDVADAFWHHARRLRNGNQGRRAILSRYSSVPALSARFRSLTTVGLVSNSKDAYFTE